MNTKKYIYQLSACLLLFAACSEKEYAIPTVDPGLKNDAIMRTIGPPIVGLNLEFAYAMALSPEEGKLLSATVTASIAGAPGTYLENRSFHTNNSGVDVGVQIGDPAVTDGNTTTVAFTRDTSAATLRYYYVVPEEARGKEITFTFSATAGNGQTVSYTMGPYQVRKMDMQRNLVLTDPGNAFLSISDMAVYDAATAAANPGKIDLIYLFRAITGKTFNHALVAPTASADYLPDVILPSGANNRTKLVKAWTIRDQQLSGLQYGVFVDDIDFTSFNFTNAPDFAINVRNEGGVWVETSDGRYRAYVYINTAVNASRQMTVSIKRYAMD
jgi:hypothetical protein